MISLRCLMPLAALSMAPSTAVGAQRDSTDACLHPPEFDALARHDNDISFSDPQATGDRVAIPSRVRAKIDALAQEACFSARAHSDTPRALADFYGRAFRIEGPDSLSLYVFDCDRGVGYSIYFFILFDPATGRVTPDPPSIYAKWAEGSGDLDPILRRPFVAFEDLDHDGLMELVVRELTHNGTSYNASVRHYYRIGRDLSLLPMLAVEERSLQDVATPETWLLRRVQYVSQDTLVLATFLSVPGHADLEVGHVLLAKNRTFGYHVVRTRVLDPRYREALITDSPAHDENFIFTGWTLRY